MALPKLLQKLFQNGGAGAKLNESIMPFAYAKSVNGKQPDSVGNIEIPARNVGDEWHSFTGQIPVGGVPYCGQEVTRATYADLWDWVQSQGLVKTESEWQALNTSQNGNVPFYSSGDGSTTFRMPKVVGYIKGAASQSDAGSYTSEGLPNITGELLPNADIFVAAGAFYISAVNQRSEDSGGGVYGDNVGFDASRSNPIYGNSEHVTPETATVLFGVYAFGEITNVGTLDADTLATGLATVEANLSAKLETSTVHIVETWSSDSSWYRVWSNGLIEQWGINTASGGRANVTFPKAFSNTAYSITSQGIGDVGANYVALGARNITPTGAYLAWDGNDADATSISWYACGY